jgi:hypothetical protein
VAHALAEMGVSIFSAFLTTWTAAMVLLGVPQAVGSRVFFDPLSIFLPPSICF